ncbi:DUF4124 domain-containing protein [Granulosicoccus sp. 3-233]|uniref:DUF4124 domain-containing protein n=1 Tax=Granulosicoccus sp. 3-233 TaxID=3417969 RepID=UPI003D35945C
MIPRISLLLLLASSTVALAQPLYKWVEPDGSITFSPEPPAGDIRYERVDSPGAAAAPTDGLSRLSANEGKSLPAARDQSPVSPDKSLPRVEYAPGNAGDLPPAISRSRQQAARSASLSPVNSALAISQAGGSDSTQAGQTDEGLAASISAASFKRSRCQDLKKRVTSLERRLQSRLTPEDMDNTVIHMARYQQSFDQYCAQ